MFKIMFRPYTFLLFIWPFSLQNITGIQYQTLHWYKTSQVYNIQGIIGTKYHNYTIFSALLIQNIIGIQYPALYWYKNYNYTRARDKHTIPRVFLYKISQYEKSNERENLGLEVHETRYKKINKSQALTSY